MTLLWTFSFITIDTNKQIPPEILRSYSFQDGKLISGVSIEKDLLLISYIAFFPEKDFTKIKLGLGEYSHQYTIHFLDKRFVTEKSILGCLTVKEYNVPDPYESWGTEEIMGNYVFEYYQDLVSMGIPDEPSLDSSISTPLIVWDQFTDWLVPQISDFYKDWVEAKKKHLADHVQRHRADLFSQFSAINSVQKEQQDHARQFFLHTLQTRTQNSGLLDPTKNSDSSKTDDLHALPPEIQNALGEMVSAENKFEHWWDIQLINEYGQPIADTLSFINGEAFLMDEELKFSQNLESMSLSALKILLDQQGGTWVIRYLKMSLPNEMGFQYCFFNTFKIGPVNYLLIMNSAIYNIEQSECLQIIRGNEIVLLEKITSEILHHQDLFTTDGLLKDPQNSKLLHHIIIKLAQSLFSQK